MSTPVTRDPAAGRVVDRTRRFVGVVVRRAVVDPVRDGRPRAHDWPPGWRSVVAVALGCCVLSALLAITSPLLRATLPLITIEAQEAVLPRATVWPLLLSIIVLLALVQTAALHAPWWLRTLGTLISVGTLLLWGFFGLVQADGLARLSPVVPLGLIIVLLVLVVLRVPRRPAWWEFPAVLAVLGIGVAAGPLTSGLVATGQALGYDAVPLLVATSIQDSALLAVPVMIAAGLSVAELTVGLTVQAGTQAARVSGRRWAYLVLGAVAAVRLTQAVVQLLGWDPVADGPATVITTLAVAGLLAGVGLTVIRIAGRPAAGTAEQLPEQANRIGLPVGVALAGLGVVASVVIIVRALGVLVLSGVTGSVDLPGLTALSSGSRLVLGVVLVLLGFRRARRRDVRQGLVLGLTGVVLVGLSSRFLTGFRWPTTLDPDLLNLVGTLAVLVIGVSAWLRHRLTPRRAVQLATALVLSALFSARDVLADPLGAVLGVSGVALVVFGVFWDLLTGSEWANRSSRRLPAASRVLLALAKTLLGLLVVGYAALARSAVNVADPDVYAELGDLVLGTALVAAAFLVILRAVEEDVPTGAAPEPDPDRAGSAGPGGADPAGAAGRPGGVGAV